MIVLFDYDSIIYKAVYRIVSFSKIREWFNAGKSKEWMATEIINLSINRLSNMQDTVFLEIENTGIDIESIEYYITVCRNSARKELVKRYKANRKRNKWVGAVRKYLIDMKFAIHHDRFEADDLIANRAKELGETNCLILSIDKDMKQIAGIHFDYYRPIVKDEAGDRVLTDCRGLAVMTHQEAEYFFWKQMLMGDAGDNIKGVPRIGKVKAAKILEESTDYEQTVYETYLNYFDDDGEEFYNTYYLLKLGFEE